MDRLATPQQQKQQQLIQLYQQLYSNPTFTELQYLPSTPEQPPPQQNKQCIFVDDSCLVITQPAFDMYYQYLSGVVGSPHAQIQLRCIASDVLMTMNCQNERVYAFKRQVLEQLRERQGLGQLHSIQKQHSNNDNKQECKSKQKQKNDKIQKYLAQQQDSKFTVDHQLLLNNAVLMKNRKSTISYTYRMVLIETKIQQHLLKEQQNPHMRCGKLLQFIQQQQAIMKRILARFHRNYFCWMYRLRLHQLVAKFLEQTTTDELVRAQWKAKLVAQQINSVEELLSNNPNDHSAIAHFHFLIKQIPDCDRMQRMDQVSEWLGEMLKFCQMSYEDGENYQQLTKFHAQFNEIMHKQSSFG